MSLSDQCVVSVEFHQFPSERQKTLLSYLKGLPGSQGLAIGDGAIDILPGLAQVNVKAHFADGKPSSSLSCQRFEPWVNNGTGTYGEVVPTVTMGESGFTVTNVSPGTWRYVMVGDDFAMEKTCWQVLDVKAGDALEFDVTLHHGATVSGRVVQDDDQRPVAGAQVRGGVRGAMTDAEGRYVLAHVRTDDAELGVRDERYVAQALSLGNLHEDQQFVAPDIRLQRGGFISGSIPRQPEMTPDLWWFGYVRPDLPEPQRSMYEAFLDKEKNRFTFRMGPLPAGTYDLNALVGCSDMPRSNPRRRWEGAVKGITVQVGQETKDVTIPIQPKVAPATPPAPAAP